MSLNDNPITAQSAPTVNIDIFIASNRADATRLCREFCLRGLCVSITEADYVFTGGMESGVRVGLINYPRFPKPHDEIWDTAVELARFLIEGTHQQSCTVVGPRETMFLSRRSWS